jgi:hypothetical protein
MTRRVFNPEALLEGVERARADVPEDHPKGGDGRCKRERLG